MTAQEFRRLLYAYGDACRSWVVSGNGWQAMDEAAAKVEAVVAASEERARRAEQAKDGAYRERDQVVALLARMAVAIGWRAGLRRHEPDPDPTWDEDWKNVVAIDLPTGQVTWHFHDSERGLFHSLPPYPATWDGHDTPEKYRRVNSYLWAPAATDARNEEGRRNDEERTCRAGVSDWWGQWHCTRPLGHAGPHQDIRQTALSAYRADKGWGDK